MGLRSRVAILLAPGVLVAVAACGGETVGVEQLNQSSGSTRSGSGSGSGASGCGATGLCETSESVTETATDSFCCVTATDTATDSFVTTDTGTIGTVTGSSGTATSVTGVTGSACVDIRIRPADRACSSASDCSFVPSGQICTGACDCGSTPVNAAAASNIEAELAGIVLDDCPCAVAGQAECIMGVCTLCGFGPNQPPGCGDATDAGTGPGEQCVDIDLSTYKTACAEASDCILIGSGELCTGNCFCPNSAVSASEQSRFDQAIAGLQFGECGCPAEPSPLCVAGQCLECFGGAYDPPGCPADAGF